MKHLKNFNEDVDKHGNYGLTDAQKEEICRDIDSEGFAYTFVDYSSFSEIKDEKFHSLRKAFLKAYKELESYVGWEEWLENN